MAQALDEGTRAGEADAATARGCAEAGGEPRPRAILDHWLEEVGPKRWYEVDEALDAGLRDRFADAWARAMEGALSLWLTHPTGALAYVVLTDQLPRNMWRGTPRAFASDSLALAAAKAAIDRDWDRRIEEPARQFFYLPLMHSECLPDPGALRAPDPHADARRRRLEPAARQGSPRGDPPLRALPRSQRGARARGDLGRGGVPGRRGLRLRGARDPVEEGVRCRRLGGPEGATALFVVILVVGILMVVLPPLVFERGGGRQGRALPADLDRLGRGGRRRRRRAGGLVAGPAGADGATRPRGRPCGAGAAAPCRARRPEAGPRSVPTCGASPSRWRPQAPFRPSRCRRRRCAPRRPDAEAWPSGRRARIAISPSTGRGPQFIRL